MFQVNPEISTLDVTLSFCDRKTSSKFNKEAKNLQFQHKILKKTMLKKDKSNIYKSGDERYQRKN